MRWLAGIGLLACSSPAVTNDALSDTEIDSLTRCDPTKPFSIPSLLPGVNGPDGDSWGWQSLDGRTLYFARFVAPSNEGDLYIATRDTQEDTYGDLVTLANRNTPNNERRPITTADGLTLLFEATSIKTDIRVSTRASTADSFSTPTMFSNINDDSWSDFNPWIDETASTLYFTSDRNGGNDIFLAERASSLFDSPQPVAELNSTFGDYMGAVSADGRELVFGSRRDTNGASGDLFRATRASRELPFEPPVKIEELSDPVADDYATWLSSDRCEILFTSNRSGSYDIWFSRRP